MNIPVPTTIVASPVIPSAAPIVQPAVNGKRNKKNPLVGLPPNDPRAAFVAEIYKSVEGYSVACAAMGQAAKAMSVSRTTLKDAVARAAQSGLFTEEELIATAEAAGKAAKMTPQAVSSALLAAGLRQRAPRSDAGKTRGPRNAPATPETQATPPPAAPVLPTDAKAFAVEMAKAIGYAKAMEFFSEAYHHAATLK